MIPLLVPQHKRVNGQPEVAAVKERYPNRLVLVAPGEAHGFIGIPCHTSMIADFIAQSSASGLQTGCLEQVHLPAIRIGE